VIPLMWLRHGVEWLEVNGHCPFESMLRLGVQCLAEGLFEPISPLRAFGPAVEMTSGGRACKSATLTRICPSQIANTYRKA
jgi:hypothetical protein